MSSTRRKLSPTACTAGSRTHSLSLTHTLSLSRARSLSISLSRALSRSISRSRSFSRSCPPHIYVCMCVCVHTHTHRFKDLPASERVIQDYACAMQSGVSYQPTALVPTGRMFISANFVGFSSQVPVQKRQKVRGLVRPTPGHTSQVSLPYKYKSVCPADNKLT